jgi:hypothetical protein
VHVCVVVSHASSVGQSAGVVQPEPVSVGPVSVGPVSFEAVSVAPVSLVAMSFMPVSVDPVSRLASVVASGPGIFRPSMPESSPGMATVGFPPHAVTRARDARQASLASADALRAETVTKR